MGVFRARTLALLVASLVLGSGAAVLVVLGERGWSPILLAAAASTGLVVGLVRAFGDGARA